MYTITFSVPTLASLSELDLFNKIDAVVKLATELPAKIESAPEKIVPIKPETSKMEAAPKEEMLNKVKDTIMSLLKINRETALAVLNRFEAAHVNTLKPENYAAFIRAANEVLEHKKNESLL